MDPRPHGLPVLSRQRSASLAWGLGGLLLALLLALRVDAGLAWDSQRLLRGAQPLGELALRNALAVQELVQQLPGRDEPGRIAAVNDFFNQRIGFRSDLDLYGVTDYWASPLETMARGAGDCEDFAIAKYFTLVAAGVSQRKLRLVYVRAMDLGLAVPHMVLAYYPTPDADPWVLDNLVPGLRPASARPDLTPVFSFNAEAIWEGVGSSPVKGSATERLSRWAAVLRKAREEGF
ncbi:transglutaminase-like cysteine peptidase [Ideonella sp. 4Y16]|uniref:transglutaminase-like cysteine peptidase n=1 Tax=Ideonella alba TaxID=2824118 RepID=UPI001B37C3AE|nr:transglutaminase-like cysteine peptidase [Ideonella alba]MBQ0944954.1 transglutaminase-like cysteine peptidase [Ideonella alba]